MALLRAACGAGETADWEVVHDARTPVWITVGDPATVPAQGWKLHLAADVAGAERVLERALPVLLAEAVCFKVAASPVALRRLDLGDGGPSQIGKFLTVYPADDAQAVRLAVALDAATADLPGPAIFSDRPLRPGSLVHYRYGSFGKLLMQTPTGEVLPALRAPDGALVPDDRLPAYRPPSWAVDPFVAAGVATPPAPSLVIGGRFVVLATLAQSPRGTVYLALDSRDGRRCVLKRARRRATVAATGEDARDRLRHEAAVLAALTPDPRIPSLYELFDWEGDLYLALEDIAGTTLSAHVTAAANGTARLPLGQVLAWGQELAALLGHVHERGFVYRDVKSTNVLITPERRPRLVDFESAVPIGDPTAPPLRGTRGYMSPQQAADARPVPADDIYGLGALLFFMATGAEPALAPGPRLLDRPLPLLRPGLPTRLCRIIARCLADEPARRYRSMAALQAALTRAGGPDGGAVGPASDPAWRRARPQDRRGRYRALARRLGDSICAESQPAPAGDGRAWASTNPAIGGGPHTRDLAAGSAGAVLALAELVRAFGERAHVATLRAGARWLAVAPPFPGSPLPGLYVGEAGIGVALLRAGQALGEPDPIAAARAKGRLVASMPHTSPDLFQGSAGRLRFHLFLAAATGAAEERAAALAAGDFLLSAAEDAGDGALRWRIPPGFEGLSGDAFLGYAHGAAGIGDALLDLFEASGEARYRAAARGAARWLTRQAVASLDDGSGLAWPVTEGDAPFAPMWCHGAAGIGRFFLHAARLDVIPEAAELAARAARAVGQGGRWAGPVQCHGLSGNIEFLLDMAETAGEAACAEDAADLARLLEAFVVERDGATLAVSDVPDVYSPDYMFGHAGVALCFLRLGHRGLPHQLSVSAFRAAVR